MTKTIEAMNAELNFLRPRTNATYIPAAASPAVKDSRSLAPPTPEIQRLSDISDDAHSSQGKEPEPSSEGESSDYSSDSDEEESELELINVDGRRNLFVMKPLLHIHHAVLTFLFSCSESLVSSRMALYPLFVH